MKRDADGHLENPKLRAIEERLGIVTMDLGRDELQYVWGLVHRLSARMSCECWGDKMGWNIPAYGTPEWRELQNAWMDSDEDEDELPAAAVQYAEKAS